MDVKKELRSRLVFIDTCIFISKHFNFGINSLGRIQQYLNDNKIHLLMPDITKREIEKKIKETSIEAHLKLKKLFKKDNDIKILVIAEGLPYSGNPNIPTAEDIEVKINEKFIEFIESQNVEIVPTDCANIKDIFDSYFSSKPPFSNAQKKYEFPDAFVLDAINTISKKRKHDLYVISSDPDMKSYTDQYDNLNHLNDINDLFSLIIHNDEELKVPAEFADKVFEYLKDEILSRALEKFQNAEYTASEYEENFIYDVVRNVQIEDIGISNKNLISVSDIESEYEVSFNVKINVDFAIPSQDDAIYDRENGKYFYLKYTNFTQSLEKEYQAIITIDYEDGIKNNADIYEIRFEDTILDVSQ